jgi:DNA mismatch repair protein MutS
MGKRLLRATILRPLVDARRLRLAMKRWPRRMATCCGAKRFGGRLAGFWILERLLARLSLDSAGPRDVRALAASLAGCRG